MNNENFEDVIERISEQKIDIKDRIGAALEEAVRAAGIYDACVTCEKTI